MTSQEGKNLEIIGVKGNFDDTQTIVKELFNDKSFKKKLEHKFGIQLSSANSINWARLLPQIVYHMFSYLELIEQKVIHYGDPVDIAIPTGNGGNILSAYYAKKMGIPIRHLICATNANNTFAQFLETGIYNASKDLIKTPSPAMDILVASNVERLLYEMTNNSASVIVWMNDLKEKKYFQVDKKTKEKLNNLFLTGWVSKQETLKTIKNIYDETSYLLDPHTAVIQNVVEKNSKIIADKVPVIISSTAHWSKFAKAVFNGLIGKINNSNISEDEFEILSQIQKIAPNQKIHRLISSLKNKKIRHNSICGASKDQAEKLLVNFLNKFKYF